MLFRFRLDSDCCSDSDTGKVSFFSFRLLFKAKSFAAKFSSLCIQNYSATCWRKNHTVEAVDLLALHSVFLSASVLVEVLEVHSSTVASWWKLV